MNQAAADRAIGIDVGGSSIKGCLVDCSTGEMVGDVVRVEAPERFRPEPVLVAIARLVTELGEDCPVGVGFPAIVDDGVLLTDPTSHEWPGWKGLDIAGELDERTGRRFSVGNDADVAALAEQVFGAARDADGTVLLLTLGTGIGSGVVRDGRLVPNVELGRIYLAGEQEVAEEQCAARIRTEQNLSWPEYAERLQRYLTHVERILAPDLIVIGGAISRNSDEFLPLLQTRAQLVTAELLGDAGIVGAAILTGLRDLN